MLTSAVAPDRLQLGLEVGRRSCATFGRTYEFMHAVSVRSYSRNSGSTWARQRHREARVEALDDRADLLLVGRRRTS